jgi:hypothetical protein
MRHFYLDRPTAWPTISQTVSLELLGMNGLELQQELAGDDSLPIVLVPWARRCTFIGSCHKSGAIEFLAF